MMPSSIQRAQDAAVALALPNAVLWTREQAEVATGLCSKTLAKHVPPVRIGRAVRWRPADVRRWADSLAGGGEGGAQ
jgi:hypothetical protein